MNRQAISHQPKSKQAYAVDPKSLHIRLTTARGDFNQVKLLAFDPFNWMPGETPTDHWVFDTSCIQEVSMTLEHQNDLYDYWFGIIDEVETVRIRYGFLLEDTDDTYFYGSHHFFDSAQFEERRFETNEYFNFPYINREDIFTAPSWVKDTVWYQIFPERFANGNSSLNPEGVLPWNSKTDVSNEDFFGGDLQGIIDHLDYIKDLGIGGIYFCPIFHSPSSHKYDTTDYFNIDPSFGRNEDFKRLVDEAHKRGIRVMLDAVFNHCGFYHPYWQDVVKKGRDSEFFDCFYVHKTPVVNFGKNGKKGHLTYDEMKNLNYETFAYASNMPKLNTNNKLMRDHLLEVAEFWIKEYKIDGWRLDVSNEVSHDFWRAFRRKVKDLNPDVYIVGENWDNSYPWLVGDQFDAVMNYELLNVIWDFIATSDRIKTPIGVKAFTYHLGDYLIEYPKHVSAHMFNMMDSHDTPRIVNICEGNLSKAMLIYVLQMIMPGSPSLYYGSEIGLKVDRECMTFEGATEHTLYKQIKRLIELRHKHPSMTSDVFEWLVIDEVSNSFVLKKTTANETLYLALNNSPSSVVLEAAGISFKLKPYGYQIEFQ